jgi:NADPH:quinone reductase-like Zn-dependent oxidoreductase
MRKIVIHKPGGYSELKIETFPDPSVGDDDVLIKVHYSGINYADCLIRFGVYSSAKEYVGWPITPGFETSGVVLKTGKNVTHVKEGDRVIAASLFGGYADTLCVGGHLVYKLPANLSMQQGAAFPAVYMTAYYALFQNFVLRKKSKLLIHSAAGGVGTALVQIAKLHDCKVYGVVGSPSKIDFKWDKVKADCPEGFDAVFDANGFETLKTSFNLLRATGKLVIYGAHSMLPKKGGRLNYIKAAWGLLNTPRFSPLDLVNQNKSIICFNLSYLFGERETYKENLTALLSWISENKLTVPKVTSFDFDKVADAHKFIESGTSTGKLVLKQPYAEV